VISASATWKQYNPDVNRRNFPFTASALAGLPAAPQSTGERPANAALRFQRFFTSEEPGFYNREVRPRYLARLSGKPLQPLQLLRRMVSPLRFEL
jgi:hypothetical protein